jgi:hypothetical protein
MPSRSLLFSLGKIANYAKITLRSFFVMLDSTYSLTSIMLALLKIFLFTCFSEL